MLPFAVVLLSAFLSSCGLQTYRLGKAFSARTQVLGQSFLEGPTLIKVSFYAGGETKNDPDKPLLYQPYQLKIDPKNGRLRPPQLFSGSAISLQLVNGIDPSSVRLRVFIKSDPMFEKDLTEIRTLVGEIEGSYANEVVFLGDFFPRLYQKFILYPDDLTGPFQGTYLRAHDLLIFEVEDLITGAKQKILFEYIPTGMRVAFGANLLLSTGIDLIDLIQPDNPDDPGQVDSNAFDLALMITMAFGYRSPEQKGASRWFGDNFMLVLDLGVGNVGAVTELIDFSNNERIKLLQNQLLVGFGVQVFDFLSVHLINNVFANFPITGPDGVNVESVVIPAFGLDLGTAIRFSRRLYERVFVSTKLKSYGEGTPSITVTNSILPVKPVLKLNQKSVPKKHTIQNPMPLDETPGQAQF